MGHEQNKAMNIVFKHLLCYDPIEVMAVISNGLEQMLKVKN